MSASKYIYDLFISYSHDDGPWVVSELIPRLEDWGIKYCIDINEYSDDIIVAEELRRLIGLSRQTLIVLSTKWLSSRFTNYELQLILSFASEDGFERFLPMRIGNCEVPEELLRFQIINQEQLGWTATWAVLYRSLLTLGRQYRQSLLAAEVNLTKSVVKDGYGGYAYLADILVANINQDVCRLDSVDVVLSINDYDQEFHGRLRAKKLTITPEGRREYASYYGPGYFRALRSIAMQAPERLDPMTLEPFTGIWFKNVLFEYSPASVAGKKVMGLSVQLMLGDNAVTHKCVCALPPLLRLPDVRSGIKFHMVLASERFLPIASGALDEAVVNTVILTACEFDSSSLLVSVAPEMTSRHDLTGNRMLHSCTGWHFTFYSDSLGATFEIKSLDPNWVDKSRIEAKSERPEYWLSKSTLENCRVDCDLAYLMAMAANTEPLANNYRLNLECGLLEGKWRPIWNLPFLYKGSSVGVLADTCEIVVVSEGRWAKQDRGIWNL